MSDLPFLIHDGSLLTLFYRVELEAARSVVPSGFEPMRVLGKALVIVAAFDYRDTSVGPYGELGVGVQVKKIGTSPSVLGWARDPRQQPEQGIWVANLPVTSEAARFAGVEQWGYPKYVTKMNKRFDASGVSFELDSEVRISMGRGAGLGVKGLPFVTFTEKGGRFVRTIIETTHRVKHGGASTVRIERLGDGPTSRTMEKLGLFSARALAAQRTDAVRAVLPAGVDAGASRPEPLRVAA